MGRPRNVDDSTSRRIQMDVGPKAFVRLQKLQEMTEAASYSEVMRNALVVYETLMDTQKAGSEIVIMKDGQFVSSLILVSAIDPKKDLK